jgi:hypothetical protein
MNPLRTLFGTFAGLLGTMSLLHVFRQIPEPAPVAVVMLSLQGIFWLVMSAMAFRREGFPPLGWRRWIGSVPLYLGLIVLGGSIDTELGWGVREGKTQPSFVVMFLFSGALIATGVLLLIKRSTHEKQTRAA